MSSGEASPASSSPTATASVSETASASAPAPTSENKSQPAASEQKGQSALRSLATIIGPLPNTVTSVESPTRALVTDPALGSAITARIRRTDSGAGDDNLCRWLYEAFQSGDQDLQLAVLRFVPAIAGVYLSRAVAPRRRPLAGMEAVLLAIYAHEAKARGGQPQTVSFPDIATNPSIYHEIPKVPGKNSVADPNVFEISPTLEPHGTIRSTKRARIVGVILELYYSKIIDMPLSSKIDFCRFCAAWAGEKGCDECDGNQTGACSVSENENENEVAREGDNAVVEGDEVEKGRRVPMPWEIFQPTGRIIGHCLLGAPEAEELITAAKKAAMCLYARAMHDMNPQAILVTRSLVRLAKAAAAEAEDPEKLGALVDLRAPDPSKKATTIVV